MNRSFPPPAREALCVLVGVMVCSAACEPDHNVKPGPPELIEFTIVQAGPTATTITSNTPECPNPVATGASCLPMGSDNGGVMTPPDALCRDGVNNLWCNCVPDETDMTGTMGAWSCEPFTNVMAVIAVFDRLLDGTQLDPGDAPGLTDVVTATAGAPTVDLLTDYSATGMPDGLIFNLFGPAFFGNFRANGPSLYSTPQPIFPSGATIEVSLDANKVRAKDGTTPFEGKDLLQSGTLIFKMAPFEASVSAPAVPTMDEPDPSIAATISLTNFADAPGCFTDSDPMTEDHPCVLADHITVTANGTAVPVHVTSADGTNYSVMPRAGTWPMGATIVVTLDATTENLGAQVIAAAVSETFTAR